MRGWPDRTAGGIGLRRGRRDPNTLHLGDTLDFWRVEAIDRGRLPRLRAEMKLPGLAWLEMRVEPTGNGRTVYRQRALFHPHGLSGHLYWWSVAPFHAIVFSGMARNLARAAVENARHNAPADSGHALQNSPQNAARNASHNTERSPKS